MTICSATRSGSCQGSTTTIEPSPTLLGAPGHVGEELHDVGAHRVVREVVLDLQIDSKPSGSARSARCEVGVVHLLVGDGRRRTPGR